MENIKDIDINFDFTTDTKGYWDCFWERNDGYGAGGNDPDSKSPTLKRYHQLLWSRELPNGEVMNLKSNCPYLSWKDFYFGSDSIIVSFRYSANKKLINEIMNYYSNYHSFVEKYLHQSYTIGGMMLFPKMRGSINQCKGMNKRIRDRWDLTLECIRRYYIGQESPLSECLERNRNFFSLFLDFKGFVDFFFLQDCVTEDYKSVCLWMGDASFKEDALPKSLDEYLLFLDNEIKFLEKRNKRIKEFVDNQ